MDCEGLILYQFLICSHKSSFQFLPMEINWYEVWRGTDNQILMGSIHHENEYEGGAQTWRK